MVGFLTQSILYRVFVDWGLWKFSFICNQNSLHYPLCFDPAWHIPSAQSYKRKDVSESGLDKFTWKMIQRAHMKTPTILKASKRRCKKDLSCRSCDICPPNPHIVTGRDEVGQGQDNNDGEEGGERERQLSHPEQLLELPPANTANEVVLPERSKFS